MSKIIYGLGSCAKALGVGVDRIRRLIFIRKIKPKREGSDPWAPYVFGEKEQKIIRSHTSMKE